MPGVEQRLIAELERPLAVFLDDVGSARELLVAHWRQRAAEEATTPAKRDDP